MSDLKTFLHKNGKVLTILYIILIIIVLLLILDENTVGRILKREGFDGETTQSSPNTTQSSPNTTPSTNSNEVPTTKKDSKIIIHNLLITAVNTDVEKDDKNRKYVGSFISLDRTTNNINNFVITNDLKSDRWYNNDNSELSESHVVMDLTYDSNKRLMAIGMKMEKGEPIYDIFQKKTVEIDSEWIPLESNGKIRSLCYDLKHGKMIGCNSYDGQIYESRFHKFSYGDWIGPINYDLPMRKVMYDKEGFMIGIGLIDNYIYKKKDEDWRHSQWDKKTINKTKVYDLIYDDDGCLIATTAKGIMKQISPDFTSEFIQYYSNETPDDGLSREEILKFRVGYEYLDDDFDLNTELGRDLKRLYEFKKISKDLCKKRGGFKKQKINSQENSVSIDELGNQNKVINDLYSQIDELTNKLDI